MLVRAAADSADEWAPTRTRGCVCVPLYGEMERKRGPMRDERGGMNGVVVVVVVVVVVRGG